MESSRGAASNRIVRDDGGPGRPGGCERGVTAASVSKLCEQGQLDVAVEGLGVLVQADCEAPKSLFYTVSKACSRVEHLPLWRRVHALGVQKGYESDTFLCNHMVRVYASHARLEEAMAVFSAVEEPDAFTWSAVISAHVRLGRDRQALGLYQRMRMSSVRPDGHVFVAALQACARGADLRSGQQVHVDVLAAGVEPDSFVCNCLVDMYAKCGSLGEARRVFDALGHKNVVTWTALIAGYSQQGMGQEALLLYRAMQEEGVAAPNSFTFVCLLRACANVAALQLGRQLHTQIKALGLEAEVLVATSLINMYGKCGSMADAQEVFDALPARDVVTWSALIAGYTCQGSSQVVFGLVRRMRQEGIQPNGVTFLSILTVCSHAGLVEEGREFFRAMGRRYHISPTVGHYTCMVDLLGKAGLLDESLALVKAMPILPDAAVWLTLLNASRKWSNAEVGRHAFDQAVKLDMKDASAYVLMSNIYTGAQMWEQARELQAWRKGVGAWKQPGQSWWTDTAGLAHSFLVGERKLPDREARLQCVYPFLNEEERAPHSSGLAFWRVARLKRCFSHHFSRVHLPFWGPHWFLKL